MQPDHRRGLLRACDAFAAAVRRAGGIPRIGSGALRHRGHLAGRRRVSRAVRVAGYLAATVSLNSSTLPRALSVTAKTS
jgi:hypothetical protein